MERFAGKVAVVTGASGGMGSAIIKELLTFNINVVGLDINTGKLKILEDDISKNTRAYTGKFFPKTCDVSNEEEIQEIFQWIHENLKTISILINGAGIFIPEGQDILNAKAETFDSILGINSKGPFLCSREAANSMIKNSEAGHIINISSTAAYERYIYPNMAVYSASKHALRLFSISLKQEILKKRANIKVTILSPGMTKTDMIPPELLKDKTREEFIDPEDIAKACISILSTPPHVSVSEYIIEPLYHVDVDFSKLELRSI